MTEDIESKYDTSWSSSGKIPHKEEYRGGGRLQQMLLDVHNRKEETTQWLSPQLKRELMFYWDNDPRYTQNLETKTQQSDQQSVVEGNGSNNYVHVALLKTPGNRSVSSEPLPPQKTVVELHEQIHDLMQSLEDKDRHLNETEDRFQDLLACLDKRESMIKEDRRAIEAGFAEILRQREQIRKMREDILRPCAGGSSVGGGSLSAPIPPMPQEDDDGREDDADTQSYLVAGMGELRR